jgi:hypothetical protein
MACISGRSKYGLTYMRNILWKLKSLLVRNIKLECRWESIDILQSRQCRLGFYSNRYSKESILGCRYEKAGLEWI